MLTLASGPGGGNSIFRSMRPGRNNAESKISIGVSVIIGDRKKKSLPILFVAIITCKINNLALDRERPLRAHLDVLCGLESIKLIQ